MDRKIARITRFLAAGPAKVSRSASGGDMLLDGGDRGTIAVDKEALLALARSGLARVGKGHVALVPKDASADRDHYQDQHRDVETMRLEGADGAELVSVNHAESPLAQLMRRKGRNGAPFLSPREYEAGERLRADFTRGQMMPRLGANWVASVASGRRGGGVVDLTDAALAARLRVERALTAVGPELSGMLIDVCCFLKGMETVESERGWPVRSAKVVLKTALGALGRHYDGDRPARGQAAPILHWGAGDYRPDMR